ncbi:MAG: NifU family protein [bacterium]|nr:NifU family protein [bacterium]
MDQTFWDKPLEERVCSALDEVRPALQADGGDVELIAIDGSIVRVALTGACHGCPMARSTLKEFVEERICFFAPEIEEVVAEE